MHRKIIICLFIAFITLMTHEVYSQCNNVIPVVYQLQNTMDSKINISNIKVILLVQNKGKDSKCKNRTLNINDFGRVEFFLPPDSNSTLVFSSNDPTIQSNTSKFYSFRKGEYKNIIYEEIIIPPKYNGSIFKLLVLNQGGAIKLCAPDKLKRGIVKFKMNDNSFPSITSFIFFNDSEIIKDNYIGGLKEGDWEFTYLNDNDESVKVSSINIKSGKILECEDIKDK